MKLPSYPRDKPSGFEWLGDVPEHWELRRLRWFLKHGYDGLKIGPFGSQIRSDELSSDGYPIYGQENVINRDFDIKRRFIDEEKFRELAVYSIRPGDILITMMGTAGRCAIVPPNIAPGIMDSHLIRLRLREDRLKHQFAQLLIDQSKYVAFQILLLGKGSIMHGLNSSVIKEIVLAVPPAPDQKAIAAFLDPETERMDQLVTKKRMLIERLKEKRTALISCTVTRGLPLAAARAAGLPENPPLRASGLDWLGHIPGHWDVRKFSREVVIAEGQVDPEVEPYSSMLLIGPEHVESATGRLLRRATAADQAAESGKYFSRKGDVIYSKIRPALRKLVIAPEDCLCSADMYPLRGRKRLDNRFIFWLFLSKQFFGWSVLESDRVAMPKINRDTLNELRMPVPPLLEQAFIADFLKVETAKLDAMMQKVEEAIERLQEYRTALITAAVTGKIDVRKAAA